MSTTAIPEYTATVTKKGSKFVHVVKLGDEVVATRSSANHKYRF